MRAKRCVRLFAIALTMTAGGSPDENRLIRFKERIRRDMTSIPNYTCLETIGRAYREPHSRSFKPVDTVRLEVSSVAGKELFAWPGGHRFEDQEITSLVTSGTIGYGMFANFARNLFVAGEGTLQYRGEENLAGRGSVRYDFHLTPLEGNWEIRTKAASAVVASHGSFWFDSASLDLIRLEAHGEAMPDTLQLKEATIEIDYARAHIGDSDALLPKRSEMVLTHFSGEAGRNAIEFSQCREYQSESKINFEVPPAPLPELPKLAVREVDLPADLLIPIELDTVIDSKTAGVGDALHARVVEEVRYQGGPAVPQGATVTGHIRSLSRRSWPASIAVGVQFSDVDWDGAHARFNAKLVDLDRNSAGTHRLMTYFDGDRSKVVIESKIPGAGIFYIDGAGFRTAPGFRMLWRTLAIPQGVTHKTR